MTERLDNHYSILIADDDPGCRETLRDILTPVGFPTYVAEDGETALELLEKKPVHLFLCDMYMRTLNGLETINLARRIINELPCILITASSDEMLVRRALEVKIYSVMNKPIQSHELLFTLRRALRRAYPEEFGTSSD
ncbi:MAG TPA: response regulator [Gemmatales bacterium]|nr:response regulator [Gemmatales bacterium]HMP16619.1 response regulator [Gemmatales bacterium]